MFVEGDINIKHFDQGYTSSALLCVEYLDEAGYSLNEYDFADASDSWILDEDGLYKLGILDHIDQPYTSRQIWLPKFYMPEYPVTIRVTVQFNYE